MLRSVLPDTFASMPTVALRSFHDLVMEGVTGGSAVYFQYPFDNINVYDIYMASLMAYGRMNGHAYDALLIAETKYVPIRDRLSALDTDKHFTIVLGKARPELIQIGNLNDLWVYALTLQHGNNEAFQWDTVSNIVTMNPKVPRSAHLFVGPYNGAAFPVNAVQAFMSTEDGVFGRVTCTCGADLGASSTSTDQCIPNGCYLLRNSRCQ